MLQEASGGFGRLGEAPGGSVKTNSTVKADGAERPGPPSLVREALGGTLSPTEPDCRKITYSDPD